MLFNKKDFDSKQRFSIRKLSVGVCSVLLSTLFLTFNEGQTVHASTDANAADTTTTSVSSNTTNNSSDNNTDKKDDSKVETSSLATAEKHAPIPIAAEVKSNKSEDQTNSATTETATQVSKSKQAQSQTTTNIVKATATQASTSSKDSSDTTSSKDNSAQNTVEKNRSTSTSKYTPVLTSETSVSTKTNQSNSNSATQEKSNIKPVTPHADSTENIAPETYSMDSDSPAYVIAGSDLTDLASKFISNAAVLTQNGATFSWVGNVPTPTQQDAIGGNTITGTIKVTYKDGTSTTIDIESYVEARSALQPSTFYYVNRVNDTPDFNTADANGNNFSTMIVNQYAYDPTAFSYKILGTLDTSSLGIHWANVQVTDNNTFAGASDAPKVIGDPYVIKVPYVVQGLKLKDNIPTDANGNPVINAQLATMPESTSTTPTTPEAAFDPAQGNLTTNVPSGLWGQYFYQDYALAYALGIKVQVAADDLDKWYRKTNNPTVANYAAPTAATWNKVSTNGISLAPTIQASDDPNVKILTDGPVTFDSEALEKLVKNPSTGAEVRKVQHTWLANMVPNSILDNNTKWPEGTKLTWAGNDGSTKLTFDKAGESKTGNVTITLPSGSSYTVKDITVISKANVIAKSETVDYGTTLTAADLVTNKNVFPDGTTYQFVDNSEPTWGTAGSYNNVKITATYKDASGASVTTPVANCAVAINDSRSIKVLVGSDVPSVDSVLNLPSTWEEHTASWTTSPNTNSTNEGVITIHYPASNLDQEIKVYVTVIPKTTAVDGQNFFTNGEKYDGTTGSIANGANQGAILTQANGQAIDYTTYSGSNTPGTQTSYDTKTTSYTPTYGLSGLQTNSDGSLVSGVQTATVRVSVPKGTIGAKVDADDNYYYELNAKVNIAQPVTFEFVDEYNNDQVVGQTYSQEFVPGIDTNLNFSMAMPDGYELGNGASIPSQYTLPAFSQTTPVVKVPIHQKMHFYITFHDEDSNTNLGTVEVSGSAAAGTGGYYPSINTKLTFPAGADAGDYYSVSTSGVPDGVQLVGSYGVSLTNPTADWTTPNYQWENTFSVLKALTGATMTINLKHKVNETQEKQTRTATVNYVKAKVNADGTYTQDGNAFTSAVLDVYYSRTKSEDLVTKKITYTPWLWDTNQGDRTTPGYHVESGKWTSLPQHWAAVVADVPTLAGYTAATVTDKSGKPANQFVFPTWNGSDQDTSNINKESLAYTENAPIYEARPVHTVLYIPNEQQARTITSKYVIAGGNKNGQEFAPDSQIQIFYGRTGTLNVANNKITYGNWQWDSTAGDQDTPGFHVISGSWSLPTNGSSWQVNIPNSGNDYVVANLRYDGAYSTFTLAAPSYNANDVFTSSTSDQWFTRNTLVTYYVPTSMVNKTVTRTITIFEPGQGSKTITQTAKLTRQVRVNNDDTGVVYDGFAGSGWSTGTWGAQDVTTHDGYTMSATQTVNGVTTPIQLVNGQVPAEEVDGNTKNTTINITWGAVATATLTGNGNSTYNGQAITNTELNNALKVNVTGPTAGAGMYTLQAGDVEFSTDGRNWTTALPTNAGEYQVRLTEQGENGIIAKYGNNSIIWTQDGKSTITSKATYTINKLAGNAVMANAQIGNYEMTYNGAAPSSIDPSKFVFTTTVNGQTVTLDVTGLDSSDFTWADSSAPVNVGTYKVILTDAGLAKLNANNTNFNLSNSGNGTFTINQANASATLSGSASREYNGQAVSVDDLNSTSTGNNITLTLHYPKDGNANYSTTVKLNADDFTWNTPNGQAPVNADSQPYTITLNSDAIEGIIKQAVGSGQNDVSNVKFANDAISGSANYTITPLESSADLSNITDGNYTKVYNAEVTNQIDASKLHITANLGGQSVDLNTTGITGSDYQWVDASGAALTSNPKNVGTYYIKLNKYAFARLQAQNPNFKLTSNDGLGVYTITQANATGELTGSNNKVYNGSAISLTELNSNGSIKVTLNFPGVNGQTYILKNGDYTISGNATDVGEYTVTLTDAGKTNVENYIKSLAGTGQGDESNVKLADNAISGNASFTIAKSANTVSVSGTQTETYNGSPISVVYNADGTNSVKVSIAQTNGNITGAVASLADVTLDSGDFAIVNGPAKNAGSYQVKLTAAGLAKIQNAVGDNYSLSLADTTGTLVINKAKASAVFSGDPSYTYTGAPVSSDDYLGKYSIKLTEPNNPTYNLVAGDIEFNVDGNWTTQAPVKVGTYQVRLSQSGWKHIKAINSDNVEWAATASAGRGSYTITPANVTTELSGSNSKVYNGAAVTTADLYADGSTIKVAINGTGIANLPTSFTLEDGDYVWQTPDGNAPVNVGNYTVKLTQVGINKIQSRIDQAVGAGNVTLTTTADDGGSASFEIKQAVAANVQLYGRENTIYNGSPVSFDPTKTETANNFGFHNVENLTVPTFTASDFTWYDGQGNALSSAPTNAGTYYLRLNTQGEKAFADANTNYTFEENGKSTISGAITYEVVPAELTVGVSGSASKVFNDKNAKITQDQINQGDIKLVWGNSTTEPTDLGQFTLTPDDLEVIDANGDPAIHANAGIGANGQPVKGKPYKVQLTAAAIEKIKQLSGATNYKISQSAKNGEYFIYEHKAELTLTGNQTTVYGTAMPFNPSKYQLAFTNWLATDVPKLTWEDGKLLNNGHDTGLTWTAGDLYVKGYPDGGVPTNVGTYRVKISKQLTDKLRQLFPDYDFSGNIGNNGVDEQDNEEEIVEPSHTPASYVITPANTTVKITGAQHVKYGESTDINVGDYSISITAPVHNETVDNNAEPIYTNVTLAAGDLELVTAPTDVGTYQVKLSAQGLQKLKDLTGSSNYDWTQAASAEANFFVEQMPVTIAVSGQSSVTYGTQDWLNAIKVNPSGYAITITTENGAALSYDTVDGDLVFNQTPGNVGEYQVELSAQGLANIERKLGTNYSYPQTAGDVTAKGTFTVKQGEVTVTLNGSDGKTYNAVPTLSSDLNLDKYNVTYSATVYSADGEAQTLTLTDNDLQIIGDATNVGTYQVELSEIGQEKLKALTGNQGDNYKWAFNTNADYVVKVATASAKLSGSNQKTFDGSAVTTAEVNSTNGDIIVNFTFPGSSAQSTYVLQTGDYTWENKDGQVITAPTSAGTYTIKLSADGITNLQNAINQYAGQGNVTLDVQDLLGAAVYTIKQKALDVILGNNSTGTDGKTYDGQAGVINTQAANFGVFTTSGLVNGETLNAANLTSDDYEWVDVSGNAITAPINAGTYYIALTANGLKKLQADNPNYVVSESGQFTYVISPAEENVTVSGSQESTSTSIDSANFTVHAPAGVTVPAGMTYEFATGVPSESGVYVIKLTPESITTLEKANPNYKLDISSDAKFILDAILNIKFEDTQDGNKQVGKTITKTGVANSTINDLKLVVPENYELAPDQELPTSYTFGKTLNQNMYIKLVHKLNELNPTDPSTNPDPTNKNWFRENGLVKDITRTINYKGLSDDQFAQIPEAQKVQTVEFTRTAKYDLITGKIVANSEGSWTAVDGKDTFAGFTPFTFAGYTAAPARVEQVKVTGDDKNSQITVAYTANTQTGKISYVDSDGKEVGQTALTGKTDQSVEVNPEAPTGWQIVSGQDIPKTVIATPTGVPTVVVKVEHSTITVTPGTPEKDIPTGSVPGDPSKNYEKLESLTADPTRTIVVTDPSGKQTTVTQTVDFTRTATFDEVTGEITYSDWTSSEPAEWQAYTAPEVAGYTATSNVSAKPVTAETKNETVNISYTANNQTGKISYVDSDGKEIDQTTISGKTGETVKVTPEAPRGWQIVSGQDIPETVTMGANGGPTVVVKVAHSAITVTPETPEKDIPTGPVPGDPSKNYEKLASLTSTPTRTIVVTDPSGKQTKVTQTVNFTRTATFDEVTGEITYSDWTSSEPAEWSEYTAPEVAGYTATSNVSVKPVTAETKNETVNISYTANTQTGKITYVDGDGKEVGQTTISGKTGETVKVTPEVPSGWRIVPGQDIPETITATATGVPTVVVKVERSTITVTPETPEKDIPTGSVPGDPSKNYEKLASLTSTPTRTIVVTDPSGKQTRVTQTVNFTRTATFDEVTGGITYSDWKLQKSNAVSHVAQWDSYTPQVITHYVPSVAEVPAKVVNAHTANSQVEITYAPASESQVIRYVDQNGKEISTQIVSGKYGLDTTFTPKLPNNWQAANTIPTSIKIGENGGLTTIVVEAKTEKVQQAKTVTETIHYHTANGKQLFADKEMEVNFFRTGVKNLVTGEITWNSWNKDEASFNEVLSPAASGYTASPAKVKAQTVTPSSEDLVFNVIYTKNSQTHPTIPENKPNKPQEENVSKQETKTQDKLIHEYGYKKRADGRLVDHTGHVYPASSKVKENGAIYSEKGELLSVGSRRKHELPQTGLHDNSLIAAIGSLLAGISIFGLLGGRKKKDDDK
ncbi:MBG domain-containing protein [Lactobacillus gasseri]|uniref:MBG domain-containing protein n=3 Tax=Bacteria TaxID=2 RepID=UPI003B787B1E